MWQEPEPSHLTPSTDTNTCVLTYEFFDSFSYTAKTCIKSKDYYEFMKLYFVRFAVCYNNFVVLNTML